MTSRLRPPQFPQALICAAALCWPAAGWSADAAAAPAKPARPATAKPAAKTTQQGADEAKGLALGKQTAQAVSDAQMQVADRVLTGDADCEFNQTISVNPIPGRPAHFRLVHKKVGYTMVPEETSTGAVRLEDKKAGIVWLQVPVKSMLMNSKLGQRLVDGCTHSEQRAAVAAAEAAARSTAAAEAAARSTAAAEAAAAASGAKN